MLSVVSIEDAVRLIHKAFPDFLVKTEAVSLGQAIGRALSEDIIADGDVPGFTRSCVDGYAVRAADTFGCSDTLPAILRLMGAVEMGRAPDMALDAGQCAYVPTGGQLPSGSDAMVMIEHAEGYGDGTIGALKPVAPGLHCVFRGDDITQGQVALKKGKTLQAHDIGTLAALGKATVRVAARPVVGILSTGDELVPVEDTPKDGQIRDVNAHLLYAAVTAAGCEPLSYGICVDDIAQMRDTVSRMAARCDLLLLSGGTSVGVKDAAPEVISALGELIFHGIAMKPGKPTICGSIEGKPIFGLPGHPVAAYFVFLEIVMPLIDHMSGRRRQAQTCEAVLSRAVPSNHGRAECVAVRLAQTETVLTATPVPGKSGLISLLSSANGYIRVPRDREGLQKGDRVTVIAFP